MNLQNLNTPTYVITLSAVTANIAFAAPLGCDVTGIFYNDSDQAAFVVSEPGDTPAIAVFPTTGNSPKQGKTIGPKTTASFTLNKGTKSCSAIQGTAGTGNLHISFGEGA